MAKRWITIPKREGEASRQAHADLPAGTFERELSKEGFYGPATQMYHHHAPTGWSKIDGPLKPRAFDTAKIRAAANTPWQAPPLLSNAHLRVRLWRSKEPMDHLVRNADGDELVFIHKGEGELYCDYGRLAFTEGDYIVLPRGTMWRFAHHAEMCALLIEATNSSYHFPEKGLLGQHAIFDPGVLDTPVIDAAFVAQQSEKSWQVRVKRREEITTLTYPYNPLDAAGWQGTLTPVKLNWRDIRPVMSHRYHIPPSVHTTFLADRFVVCTFCPRPLEQDPGALKVPFFHNNDDYEEIIFYHAGQFFSRDNIHPGMLTLHPSGITHGPHPKAFAAGKKAVRKETDEVAVMIDARDAVEIAEPLKSVELKEYADSWKSP